MKALQIIILFIIGTWMSFGIMETIGLCTNNVSPSLGQSVVVGILYVILVKFETEINGLKEQIEELKKKDKS